MNWSVLEICELGAFSGGLKLQSGWYLCGLFAGGEHLRVSMAGLYVSLSLFHVPPYCDLACGCCLGVGLGVLCVFVSGFVVVGLKVGSCCLFWINELAAPLLQFVVMALFMHCQCFWEHWQSRARCFNVICHSVSGTARYPRTVAAMETKKTAHQGGVGIWFDFLAMRWNYEMDATIVTFRGRSSFFFKHRMCLMHRQSTQSVHISPAIGTARKKKLSLSPMTCQACSQGLPCISYKVHFFNDK